MAFFRSFWVRLPLIGRLLAAASVALLVAGLVMLFVSAREEAAEIRADLHAELAKELDTLPAVLAEMAVVGDFASLQQTLDRYVGRDLIAGAAFRDVGGARLQSWSLPAVSATPAWFIELFGLPELSGSAPVVVGGRSYGELTLTVSARSMAERSWSHLKSHLAVLLLAIAIDFLGIWLVLRSSLAPLRQLVAGADALAAGQLDIRLTPHGSPELRHVIVAFDRMAKRVQAAQNSIRQSEERLKLAVSGANDGIWDWDMRSNALYLSPRWKAIIGYADSELPSVTDSFELNLHPDDRPRVLGRFEDFLLGAVPHFEVEFRMRHKDGSWRWILARGEVLRDERGVPYRMAGSHADLTERKLAESRLQLAASVFTHAREGIMITDPAGIIVEVNDTFSRITGYSRAEALGQNPRMLKSGRQGPEYYALMWRALHEKGHWDGEAWNRRKSGEVYAEMITISAVRDANGVVCNYVALFTDITPMKEHEQQLEHIAHYDALTGLPNRVLLADRLQQAIAHSQRRAQSLGVVYLDLDGFKAINDRYGHETGDELLIAVAQRMKAALREGDTIARIGGDEFVAVLADLERPQDCEPVLERLLLAAAAPVQIGAQALHVSASIGVTLYPQDGVDADLLLRHADQAMYLAKQAGKNRYHLFDVGQDEAAKSHRESLGHIRHALGQGQFVLYYQPKVNMKTGQVIGAEALIRWRHPERGLLAPAAFLPIIEEHAISVDLGEWVIDAALGQMAAWRAAGLKLPVSVNVGARQLQQSNFVERLAALLARHPEVPASALELEILETSALEDMAQVTEAMHACKVLGVGFALDDFGTGYSSLTYLKRLPVELLKIDQSFVRDMLDDPEDLAIIEGVLGLAAAFRRKIIAEGVESVAHGELLLLLGCELAQGYGIARPMPAADLPGWVAGWRPDPAWSAWRERPLNRDNPTVAFVEVEHRHWLRALEAYLAGEREAPPQMDAGECHFGRWHGEEGRLRYGETAEFRALGRLHERLHALARELLAAHAGGAADCAPRLAALQGLRDELIERLQALVRESDSLRKAGAGEHAC